METRAVFLAKDFLLTRERFIFFIIFFLVRKCPFLLHIFSCPFWLSYSCHQVFQINILTMEQKRREEREEHNRQRRRKDERRIAYGFHLIPSLESLNLSTHLLHFGSSLLFFLFRYVSHSKCKRNLQLHSCSCDINWRRQHSPKNTARAKARCPETNPPASRPTKYKQPWWWEM